MTNDARWVDLEGTANARDLGGLPLAGGGTTAPGVVLRTDNLQDLTPADIERLVGEHGVRVVVDLRTSAEVRREGPGPLTGDARVEIRHRSLYPESGDMTDVEVDSVMPWQVHTPGDNTAKDETPAVRAYLAYLEHRPDSIVGALRDIATTDGAVVVHCAAGKDRTGVVAAFALEVAGVEREAVVGDYTATGEVLEALLARLVRSPTYAPDIVDRDPDHQRPRPETMRRVLAVVDERHGGAAAWLRAHGLADDELEALRTRLAGARASA